MAESRWNYNYEEQEERDGMKRRLERELEKRRKGGDNLAVFEPPTGTKITRTFWGNAWCKHLESYADYAYRLPRGRSYLRGGKVYNLTLKEGRVTASVAGSELYDVEIKIAPLPPSRWEELKEKCRGQVAGLVELLEGKLGPGVMTAVTNADDGLFPSPKEIKLSCSCPDHADLCKHCGAALYGVGVLFDREPDLFFKLRGVNPAELIATTAEAITRPSNAEVIDDMDIGDIFGIDLGGAEPPPQPVAAPEKPKAKPKAKRAAKKVPPRKP